MISTTMVIMRPRRLRISRFLVVMRSQVGSQAPVRGVLRRPGSGASDRPSDSEGSVVVTTVPPVGSSRTRTSPPATSGPPGGRIRRYRRVTSRRLRSATTSRDAPAGRVTVSPVSVRAVPAAMPAWSMSCLARAGSAQSTWTTTAPAPRISSSMGPWRITRPWSTIATASQVRSTSSSRCEDSTTVRPSSARLAIMARISCMPAGSSPFIGSSRMSSSGSASRHAATPRRWRMPIEYVATLSPARSARPTLASDGAIRCPRRRPGRRPAGGGCPGRSGGGGSGARRRSPRPGPGPGSARPGRGCRAATSCRRWPWSGRARCGSGWSCPRRSGRGSRRPSRAGRATQRR